MLNYPLLSLWTLLAHKTLPSPATHLTENSYFPFSLLQRIFPEGATEPHSPPSSCVEGVSPNPRTLGALLTWKAVAFKREVTCLPAGATIDTGGGCTGHIWAVTVLACEALRALALIGTRQVEAGATMLALSWNITLIDISLTLVSCEACEAFAGELVGHSGTGTSICTGMR